MLSSFSLKNPTTLKIFQSPHHGSQNISTDKRLKWWSSIGKDQTHMLYCLQGPCSRFLPLLFIHWKYPSLLNSVSFYPKELRPRFSKRETSWKNKYFLWGIFPECFTQNEVYLGTQCRVLLTHRLPASNSSFFERSVCLLAPLDLDPEAESRKGYQMCSCLGNKSGPRGV